MFDKLLLEFQSITRNQDKSDENFFEICGFSHYENVISNVLTFFFDDQNPHDLNGLLIKSLLAAAEIEIENKNIGLQFQAEREVRTQGGGYIDILLHNEDACIIIENKIYAGLNNDLEDYFKYAKNKNKDFVFGVFLTLFKTDPQNKNFINVTYSNLINKIRNNLGMFVGVNHNKYLLLLIELINNIETLKTGATSMNLEFVKFIRNNHEEVQRLGAELKTFHDDLRRIVKEVNSIVAEIMKNNDIKQSVWRELPELYDVAVSDFQLKNGIGIAVTAAITPSEWLFHIFPRANPEIEFLIKDFCIKQGLTGHLEGDHFILNETMPIGTKTQDVARKITDIIRKLTTQ